MGRYRRPQAPIIDPATDPRQWVNLRVAAEYLERDERTLRSRIQEGKLIAQVDGKVIRVSVRSIAAYERKFHEEPSA